MVGCKGRGSEIYFVLIVIVLVLILVVIVFVVEVVDYVVGGIRQWDFVLQIDKFYY